MKFKRQHLSQFEIEYTPESTINWSQKIDVYRWKIPCPPGSFFPDFIIVFGNVFLSSHHWKRRSNWNVPVPLFVRQMGGRGDTFTTKHDEPRFEKWYSPHSMETLYDIPNCKNGSLTGAPFKIGKRCVSENSWKEQLLTIGFHEVSHLKSPFIHTCVVAMSMLLACHTLGNPNENWVRDSVQMFPRLKLKLKLTKYSPVRWEGHLYTQVWYKRTPLPVVRHHFSTFLHPQPPLP